MQQLLEVTETRILRLLGANRISVPVGAAGPAERDDAGEQDGHAADVRPQPVPVGDSSSD